MGATAKNERVLPKDISAGALIKGGPGRFYGFYVNSTTSGTLKIYDGLTTGGTVIFNTITPAVGSHHLTAGVEFATGLYVDVGSTIDVTIFYA